MSVTFLDSSYNVATHMIPAKYINAFIYGNDDYVCANVHACHVAVIV